MSIRTFFQRLLIDPWDFRHPNGLHITLEFFGDTPLSYDEEEELKNLLGKCDPEVFSGQDHHGRLPIYHTFAPNPRNNQDDKNKANNYDDEKKARDVFFAEICKSTTIKEKYPSMLKTPDDEGQCILDLEAKNFWEGHLTHCILNEIYFGEDFLNDEINPDKNARNVQAASEKNLSVMAFAFPWYKVGNWLHTIWPGTSDLKCRILDVLDAPQFLDLPKSVVGEAFSEFEGMYDRNHFLDQLRKIVAQLVVLGLVFLATPFLCLGRYVHVLYNMVRDDFISKRWQTACITFCGLIVCIPLILSNALTMLLVGMVRTVGLLCWHVQIQLHTIVVELAKFLWHHRIVATYLTGIVLTLLFEIIGRKWLTSPWWIVRMGAVGHLSLITFFFFSALYIFVMATGDQTDEKLQHFPSYFSVITLVCFCVVFWLPIPFVEQIFTQLVAVNAFTCIIPIVLVSFSAAIMWWRHHHASAELVYDDGQKVNPEESNAIKTREDKISFYSNELDSKDHKHDSRSCNPRGA